MQGIMSKFHQNRVFTLLVWLIIVFIAIISAPSITNTLQRYSQPTFSANSQPQKAANLRDQWGYQLGHSQTINIVYENPSGKLTSKQKQTIQSTIDGLKKHQSYYSIKRIVTPSTNVSGQAQMLSKDCLLYTSPSPRDTR